MQKRHFEQEFSQDFQTFRDKCNMTITTFGKLALNDGSFIGRLKKGFSPRIDRIQRVYDFMYQYNAEHDVEKLCS